MERGGRRVVAVGAATGCVAEVGGWVPVGCGDTGSSGAEARRDYVEPLAYRRLVSLPATNKAARVP